MGWRHSWAASESPVANQPRTDMPPDPEDTEPARVWRWRFDAARKAGLTHAQAVLVADGDCDLELLRKLSGLGVDRRLIARICR